MKVCFWTSNTLLNLFVARVVPACCLLHVATHKPSIVEGVSKQEQQLGLCRFCGTKEEHSDQKPNEWLLIPMSRTYPKQKANPFVSIKMNYDIL